MHARCCLIACLTLALSACGTVPMTAITENGHTFHGTLSVDIPTTFQISDGRVSCSGKFPTFYNNEHGLTLPMVCDHGLKGIAIFSDVRNLRNGGGGILRLSDGTAGTFITGEGAAGL